MTQKELLNYILEKEKLKKEDLAKLFGIRKENTEKVFNGEKPLTKRQIKNISRFTQIPEEAITRGELVLPDLQNTGVVFVDEEFVKNQNTARLQSFIKNRFKIQFISLFLLKLFVYFILIFLSIFAGCAFYSAFIENIDKSTVFSAFFTLIPYLLGFASIVPMFKVIKKVNFNEVKRVKIYYYFIIVANLISLIGLVALNANHWAFFVTGLFCTLIPLMFLILENNKKLNEKQIKILSTVLIFVSSLALQIVPEYIKYLETDREMYFAIIFVGLNLTLIAAHICYWAIKDFSEFLNKFQMLNNKKCLKKKKVLHSLVSVLLVTIIVAGTTHFGMLVVIKVALTNVIGTYDVASYSVYDKQNIVFTDEDETQTIQNGDFTYKLPVEFIDKTNKDRQTETFTSLVHYNADETIMVASTYDSSEQESFSDIMSFDKDMFDSLLFEQDILFEESLKIMFTKHGEITKNLLEKKYGFVPKTFYEYQKLESLLNPQEINYWNKQEAISYVTLLIMHATTSPAYFDKIYLCETEKEAGVLYYKEHINEETGVRYHQYHYSFDAPNSSWSNKAVVVRLPEELASTDLAYKIINSVEIK